MKVRGFHGIFEKLRMRKLIHAKFSSYFLDFCVFKIWKKKNGFKNQFLLRKLMLLFTLVEILENSLISFEFCGV